MIALALGLLAASTTNAPTSVAFFGASAGLPVDAALSAEIEDALVAQKTVALQSHDATKHLLDAAKGLGVDCDPLLDQCLLQLAAVCTVQQALYPKLDGDRLTLRLALVDGGIVRLTTLSLSNDVAVRHVEVHDAIGALFAAADTATLVVDAPLGSTVSIDGLARGRAPLDRIAGLAPGHHYVDVRFTVGSSWSAPVELAADRRTRLVATPRPFAADALTWSGGTALVLATIAAGIATYTAGLYLVSRADLEDFSTHYARDRDYNDANVRAQAILDQDHLTDLPTYGVPLFITAGALGAVGVASGFVGLKWSSLFDPPPEEGPQ